ncbi:hypothetical protein D3C85_1746300 [compost metagenome]
MLRQAEACALACLYPLDRTTAPTALGQLAGLDQRITRRPELILAQLRKPAAQALQQRLIADTAGSRYGREQGLR